MQLNFVGIGIENERAMIAACFLHLAKTDLEQVFSLRSCLHFFVACQDYLTMTLTERGDDGNGEAKRRE